MTVDPIPLYIAENIEKLDEVAKDKSVQGKAKLDLLCKAADRVFATAAASSNQRDEEKQYVYYKRFIQLVNDIARIHNDKTFTDFRFGSELKKSNDRIEILKASLLKRYGSKQQKPVKNVSKPVVTTSEVKTFKFSSQFITPDELYQAYRQGIKLILWDARSAEEYTTSKIKGLKNINIPSGVIKKGYSANVLSLHLPKETVDEYNSRGEYTYIVLMDWRTSEGTFGLTQLQVLHNIVTMWDSVIYKNKPVILDGGYLAWLDKYPTFSTNSSVYTSNYYEDFDDLLSLDDIEYPGMGDEKSKLAEEPEELSYDDTRSEAERAEFLLDTINALCEQEDELMSLYEELDLVTEDLHLPFRLKQFNSIRKSIAIIKGDKEDVLPVTTRIYEDLYPKLTDKDLKIKIDNELAKFYEMESTREHLSDRLDQIDPYKVDVKPAVLAIPAPKVSPPKPSGDTKPEINRDTKPVPSRSFDKPKVPAKGRKLSAHSSSSSESGKTPHKQPRGAPRPKVDRNTKPQAITALLTENGVVHEGLVGLHNISNTCYQNTLVQAIRHIDCMATFFLRRGKLSTDTDSNTKILKSLTNVVNKLYFSKELYIKTYDLYDAFVAYDPAYGKGTHEDVHQFFLSILGALVEDTKKKIPIDNNASPAVKSLYTQLEWYSSIFSENFFHQIQITIECPNCHKRSIRFEMENCFMLSIPGGMEGQRVKLSELMKLYITGENPERQTCKYCKVQCINERKVVRYPKVAAICVKRYSLNGQGYQKNEQECEFTENLRISQKDYKLMSIACHIGTTELGHYTAICRNPITNKFYEFNDTNVILQHNINNSDLYQKCYMLFYEARIIPSE